MDDLVKGLTEKVGLSEEKAKEVMSYLQSHGPDVIAWLKDNDTVKDIAKKLPGGLGNLL